MNYSSYPPPQKKKCSIFTHFVCEIGHSISFEMGDSLVSIPSLEDWYLPWEVPGIVWMSEARGRDDLSPAPAPGACGRDPVESQPARIPGTVSQGPRGEKHMAIQHLLRPCDGRGPGSACATHYFTTSSPLVSRGGQSLGASGVLDRAWFERGQLKRETEAPETTAAAGLL